MTNSDELPRAVHQAIEIFEVLRQSHVAEDCLFEFAIQCVINTIDTYAILLMIHSPILWL
jgi:hypothetical protein